MALDSVTVIRRELDPAALRTLASLPPLLARLYAARGITSPQELELGLADLLDIDSLLGIDRAVAVLQRAVTEQQTILVIGDFDADGATSTALAVRALRAMGAQHVDYLVPNRFDYGYGLTPEIVAVAAERRPDVIITVDNGISSLDGVDAANQFGIAVVVTDHHLAGSQLPNAAAIVNPNQPGCRFASKHLAGVGVIFYVMSALRKALRDSQWFTNSTDPKSGSGSASMGIAEPNLAQYLDLVALGTVADVVALDHNNRIMVAQGLKRIRRGLACPGVLALVRVAGRDHRQLVSTDLGFALGPRLNAAGRLEDMSLGIECLLTENEQEAARMAWELDSLNQSRKEIEADMQAQALAHLESLNVDSERSGLCLYHSDWHQGVVGILASRIKERFHRPVIAFADADESFIKGSARSIKGLHIRDALDAVAKRYPALLSKFGGHAMAAGLSILRADFDDFSRAFDEEVARRLSADDLQAQILTDGELPAQQFSLAMAELLRNAGPWGQAFPEPLFDGCFEILQQRLVGDKHLKLKVALPESGAVIDAIAFFVDLERWPNSAQRARLCYRLDVNEYRGERSLQLLVTDLEAVD